MIRFKENYHAPPQPRGDPAPPAGDIVLTLVPIYENAMTSLVPQVHSALCQQLRCYVKGPSSHMWLLIHWLGNMVS